MQTNKDMEAVLGLPAINADVVPKDLVDEKEKEGEEEVPSAINWTTMFLTLFFFPAFVAFQNAIQESINYNLPQPNSGIVWFNGLGNSTLVQCYAPVTTGQRVAWAWGSFVILLAFGFLMAFVILWVHVHYYGWHKYARQQDANLSRGERLWLKHMREQKRKQQKAAKNTDLLET